MQQLFTLPPLALHHRGRGTLWGTPRQSFTQTLSATSCKSALIKAKGHHPQCETNISSARLWPPSAPRVRGKTREEVMRVPHPGAGIGSSYLHVSVGVGGSEFAAGSGHEVLIRAWADATGEETHRAVAEQEIAPTRVLHFLGRSKTGLSLLGLCRGVAVAEAQGFVEVRLVVGGAIRYLGPGTEKYWGCPGQGSHPRGASCSRHCARPRSLGSGRCGSHGQFVDLQSVTDGRDTVLLLRPKDADAGRAKPQVMPLWLP